MALRDKIRDRVTPHLPPGESYHSAFMAQGGPSPYWALLATVIVLFGAKYRVIAVTDKQVHVFKQSMWKAGQPKELLSSHPAGTILSVSEAKLWGKLHLGGERLWVHRRFHGDVSQANVASQNAATQR